MREENPSALLRLLNSTAHSETGHPSAAFTTSVGGTSSSTHSPGSATDNESVRAGCIGRAAPSRPHLGDVALCWNYDSRRANANPRPDPLAPPRGRPREGGAFTLALELAAEAGRVFPVVQRARGDADRGCSVCLAHPPADQPGGAPLLGLPLAPAAELVASSFAEAGLPP